MPSEPTQTTDMEHDEMAFRFYYPHETIFGFALWQGNISPVWRFNVVAKDPASNCIKIDYQALMALYSYANYVYERKNAFGAWKKNVIGFSDQADHVLK